MSNNVIVPEIFKNIVGAKFKEKVKLLNLAVDLGQIPEFSEVGDTIHFPKFKALDTSKMKEMKKGDILDVTELEQEDSTAVIKQVGFASRVFDIVDLTAFGNHVQENARQHATIFARKLDNDIAKEAQATPLKVATGNADTLTIAELSQGMTLFGDEIDTEEFSGIVINSRLVGSMYAMPEFVNTGLTYTKEGNGIVKNGCIGLWRGIPVYVADHGTYDTTKKECITYIIKNGALGYKMKRDLNIELDRQAKSKATDVVTDMIYATKLLKDDGLVVIRKTIA